MHISIKNKKLLIPFFAIIAIMVTIIAIVLFNSQPTATVLKNKYTITAEYDPQNNTLKANMELLYNNNGKKELDDIILLLFPNAFNQPNTAPFQDADLNYAYPNGFSYGGIEISNVCVNGKSAETRFSDNKQQLTVLLGDKLSYGKSVIITLDFVLTIPNASGRFGVIDQTVNLGNWYPIAAVNNDGERIFSDYTSVGDPFYSDISDYKVNITLPSSYTPAASSHLIGTINGDITTWTTQASGLRDFALSFSPNYKVHSQIFDGINVNCYYKSSLTQAEVAVKAATDAIKLFQELFGAYPYEQFNIVQTSFFIGGMEYPGLVFIDDSYFQDGNLHPLENVVVHECAHQWWYGSAGNDQINTPWIDEGLATYSTMLYYQRYKDDSTYKLYYKYYITNGYRFHRDNMNAIYGKYSQNMNIPLDRYDSDQLYNMLCYEKSAMMLQSIRELLGDDLFFANIKELYTSNVGGIITAEDFIVAFSRNTSKPVREFINSWLEDRVHIQ